MQIERENWSESVNAIVLVSEYQRDFIKIAFICKFSFFLYIFIFLLSPTETDSHIQNDNCQSDHENGLDIENDDDYPLMSDLDVADHDPNDMSRPRKIRR